MAIEFRVLGPLEALEDGRPLALGGPRQRSLLAILLLQPNTVIPVSRLIDELWGEAPAESATNIVQGYVSDLRRVLGRDSILTKGRGYVLQVEPARFDLRRFEQLVHEGRAALEGRRPDEAARYLREAMALWRGAPLADLLDEPFAAIAAARLEELRLTAIEARIDADLALGHHDELAAELVTLVEDYPLRERFRAQYMLALYRSGRQAEALAGYRAARESLADELGIDPSPALRNLEKAILEQDPSLDLAAPISEQPRASAPGIPQRVVLAVALDRRHLQPLLDIGRTLARKRDFELVVARMIQGQDELSAATRALHEAIGMGEDVGARGAVFTSRRPAEDVLRLASEQDVAILLVDGPTPMLDQGLFERDFSHMLRRVPCDVALLIPDGRVVDGPVVVPFGGSEHDWAAIEFGSWLARMSERSLRLIGTGAVPAESKRDASRLLFHASLAIQRAVGIAAEPILADPGAEGMLTAVEGGGVLVLGLSDRWQREGLGPSRLALARLGASATFVVRRGIRPGGMSSPENLTRFTWSFGPPVS